MDLCPKMYAWKYPGGLQDKNVHHSIIKNNIHYKQVKYPSTVNS